MVPKNTPEDVVARLHKAIRASLQEPSVRTQLAAQTMNASTPMSLAEASAFFEAETAHYRAIARRINLQPQ
jgi:tripartite-type tricarboxylate transporter receptor subunit TctC